MESKRDRETFISLYEKIYGDLYRFAFYTLKNRQDAEDVVQDTAADAYGSFGNTRSRVSGILSRVDIQNTVQ